MSIEAQTKIGLISKALILCSETVLSSLSDDRYGAQVGSNLFEMILENELQSNPWRFCAKKAALSRLNVTLLNQFKYAFQIPSDCLLPRFVYPATTYEIYGDRVYANQLTVEMDYTFKPEIAAIPAYFSMLLTYALARDMIKPITSDKGAAQIMQQKYVLQRDRAMYADAQGRPASSVADSPFVNVRG